MHAHARNRRELSRKVSSFVLRRTQAILQQHLPPLSTLILFCRPTAIQARAPRACVALWAAVCSTAHTPCSTLRTGVHPTCAVTIATTSNTRPAHTTKTILTPGQHQHHRALQTACYKAILKQAILPTLATASGDTTLAAITGVPCAGHSPCTPRYHNKHKRLAMPPTCAYLGN